TVPPDLTRRQEWRGNRENPPSPRLRRTSRTAAIAGTGRPAAPSPAGQIPPATTGPDHLHRPGLVAPAVGTHPPARSSPPGMQDTGSTASDTNEQIAKLARIYRALADAELHGYCPIYERLSRAMAADDEMLARYVELVPRVSLLPVLLFACVHDLVLDG